MGDGHELNLLVSKEEYDTLRAEVARLREALEKLVKGLDGTHQGSQVNVGLSWAQAALSPADGWLAAHDAEKDAALDEAHAINYRQLQRLEKAEAARDSYRDLVDAGTAACAEVDTRCEALKQELDQRGFAVMDMRLRAEKAEQERDGLRRRHSKSGHDMDTSGICDADCPTCARIKTEARREALVEVYERVKNLRGCNAYDVIEAIHEMAEEAAHEQ